MARPSKSVTMKSGLMTKEEINKRLEGELKLRGSDDELTAPDYLNETQEVIFNYLLDNLKSSGVLGNIDIFILSQTAITIDRIQECEKNINEHGMVMYNLKPNPNIKVRESYTKDLFRLCNELCLSPQARAKLSNMNFKAEQDSADPLLTILDGGLG